MEDIIINLACGLFLLLLCPLLPMMILSKSSTNGCFWKDYRDGSIICGGLLAVFLFFLAFFYALNRFGLL
tara:strand:+ start:205 stop:414 length:210 start_codon:yes stop_codon:yes gene_type:complete